MSKRKESTVKVGQVYTSWYCGDFIVTHYNGYRDVGIKFLDTGYECTTRGDCVVDGRVKDVLAKSVYGVGFVGIGPHKPTLKGVKNPAYTYWHAMMTRCYGISLSNYDDCSVDTKWHNFQNFADWYETYTFKKDGFQLDKDLKIKGNRVYSEDACSFVPRAINALFSVKPTQTDTGTHFRKDCGKYTAQINFQGEFIFLGYHETCEQAVLAYKTGKSLIANKLANEYKHEIDPDVYKSLSNWFSV